MILRLVRAPEPTATTGRLFIDGTWECFTLERAKTDPVHPAIPAGTYPVTLTVSPRAVEGELWSPDPQHRLPLLDVPGRSGIRIHAANEARELEGCIAVGQERAGLLLMRSRLALTALLAKLTYPSIITITEE